MDLLRIASSGSVDDGKSTLIGRLLYETNQIPDDKLAAIESSSAKRGLDFVDLSLLTDGLIAERAQGITIDVAHIYFNTPKRKYIIADTPGHIEYTRNMVTGASNTQATIILIDARKGILEQTKRHLFIAHLLQLPHVIIAINKMDLVGFDERVFENIKNDFEQTVQFIGFNGKVHYLPISALKGEGVTQFLGFQKWYQGPALLDLLETLPISVSQQDQLRFQVQHIIRPKSEKHPDFRGFAGSISLGKATLGAKIRNARTAQSAKIQRIEKWGQALEEATNDLAVTLLLDKEIDVQRGDILLPENDPALPTQSFKARICWLSEHTCKKGSTYLLQQGTAETKSKITSINSILDLSDLKWKDGHEIGMNDIAEVEIKTAKAFLFDPYSTENKTGAFILINAQSKQTEAVGFYLH
jgi:sulfate adenylyltransferase subunit 1